MFCQTYAQVEQILLGQPGSLDEPLPQSQIPPESKTAYHGLLKSCRMCLDQLVLKQQKATEYFAKQSLPAVTPPKEATVISLQNGKVVCDHAQSSNESGSSSRESTNLEVTIVM